MISLIGNNLTAGYGGVDIIKNITLEVKQGEIAVIVGPNGAGKSTAMKALLGMLKLTDGSVSFADDDISSICGSFSFLIKKNKIVKVAIAYGGMSEIPKRASAIEKKLTNSEFSKNTFNSAVNLINKDFSPLDDMRASRNYRIIVAKNLLLKAFYEIKNKQTIRWKSGY